VWVGLLMLYIMHYLHWQVKHRIKLAHALFAVAC